MATKRSRASKEQIRNMVDFMAVNPELASGKFLKFHGKYENNKKWSELTTLLNGLGGADKAVDQWQTVWKDLKSRTCQKYRERKRQLALTGNRPISLEPLTDLETKIVSIIGTEYVEGDDSVKENVPLEEDLQLLLEDGEGITQATSTISPSMPSNDERSSDKTRSQRGSKRKHEEREDLQLKFLEIAKNQAESFKMLAESSAANNESTRMMAEGIKTMGEGLKACASAFNNLTNAINNAFNYN
ncbi:uncharacterized protein [Musca autumnalis]|uniref:uncharacterized protein n=1 Tax=Musca autumnalis TaxID=221902 RepID=UPI003CF57326